MSRIPTPPTIDAAPPASQPLLENVKKQFGAVPNLFRLVANSPAALEGYLALSGALAKGTLPAPTRERIALAVAAINGCDYCLAAHTYLGKNLARLDDAEIAANRAGTSNDVKADAAVRFAVKVAQARGHVGDDDVSAVKAAGYDDAQVIEIVLHVALNTWTNYVNEVAKTDIDFPVAALRKASCQAPLRRPAGAVPASPGLPGPTHEDPAMSRPPLPPFTAETAAQKARMAEDAWNTRDPARVALAYTVDSRWRNRSEFLEGRAAIEAFLIRKWSRELDYRLIKEVWAFRDNRIAVRFAYEWHDDSGNWFRSYGNENWEFDAYGLMRLRIASINDLPIKESERKYHWPLGRRPDDHASLSELGL